MPTEIAESDSSESDQVPDSGRRDGNFRRNGLPRRALVDRTGDLWIVSSEREQLDTISHVLALRLQKLRELGFDEQDMLPWPAQQEIQKALFEEWLEEPLGSEMRRRWSQGTSDTRIRNIGSAWKTTQFHRYGGQVWLRILIALGDIPNVIIGICNEIVAEKVRQAQREPTTGLVEGPRLSARSLAASQGQVPPPVQAAKRAREQAKRTQKKLLLIKDQWRNGAGRGASMSWAHWNALERQLEDLFCIHIAHS